MILIIFKIKNSDDDYFFIPLVNLRNSSKETIIRYGTGGVNFFPNAMETKKMHGFKSYDSVIKYIESYDFIVAYFKYIDIDINIDYINKFINGFCKEIKIDNIVNLFSLITSFHIFIHSDDIDYDKLKIIVDLSVLIKEKELYDEFVNNINSGLYSDFDLTNIKMEQPNDEKIELLLKDSGLKHELKYLIEIFNNVILINPTA
jgi:hypothetical protein